MKLTKCSNKHFYDADQFTRCPHCDKAGLAPLPPFQVGPMRHVRTEDPNAPPPSAISPHKKSTLSPVGSVWEQVEPPKTESVMGGFASGEKNHGTEDLYAQFTPRFANVSPPDVSGKNLFCGNCGAEFRGTGLFCIRCGAKVAKPDAAPHIANSVEALPSVPDVQPSSAISEAQPSALEIQTHAKEEKAEAPVAQESDINENTPPIQESLQSQINAVSAHNQTEDVKTMAFYNFTDVEPVVGWLVSIKGEYLGQGFNLKAGQNFIGRSLTMDMPLAKDTSVSRNKHAVVTFDPQNHGFFIQPGESSGLTYLNNDLVLTHQPINPYDRIKLGSSEFVFVPFCGEQFSWEDVN